MGGLPAPVGSGPSGGTTTATQLHSSALIATGGVPPSVPPDVRRMSAGFTPGVPGTRLVARWLCVALVATAERGLLTHVEARHRRR
ncbi:MAG: hypothetical protein IPH38_08485 [Candidatus Microthrix sp.]|nr:hypothetical protein [Candidatus Microthrix sp.]MBK7019615.1 hypothetical protein [Candidatus Microthrix sp.]